MDNAENEFKDYLNSLLNRLPKPENNSVFAPSTLKYGHYTREFNREASKKLDEILSEVSDQPEERDVLTNILNQYRTKFMTGQY